jgi:hypothetical protein
VTTAAADSPLGGPQELLDRAAGKVDPYPVLTATARSLGWMVALTFVGAALWAWPPGSPARTPPAETQVRRRAEIPGSGNPPTAPPRIAGRMTVVAALQSAVVAATPAAKRARARGVPSPAWTEVS